MPRPTIRNIRIGETANSQNTDTVRTAAQITQANMEAVFEWLNNVQNEIEAGLGVSAPGPISNLTFNNITSSGFAANFSSSGGTHALRLRLEGTTSWTLIDPYSSGTAISGLGSAGLGAIFEVQVQRMVGTQVSTWFPASPSTVQLSTNNETLSALQSFNPSAPSAYVLRFAGTPSAGHVDTFDIQYVLTGGLTGQPLINALAAAGIVNIASLPHDAVAPDAGAQYAVRMRQRAGTQTGPWAPTQLVTTPAAAVAGTGFTTLTMKNTGASQVTGEFTQRVMGFKRGAVPNAKTNANRVTVNGVPVQQDAETYWESAPFAGSLKAAVLTIPTGTLAAGATAANLPVSFEAGAPNRTPVVTLAQLVSNSDFRFDFSGFDLGSDVFRVSVNDIINLGSSNWGSNPVRGWEVESAGPVRSGWHMWSLLPRVGDGAFHRWLRCDIWIDALSTTKFSVAGEVSQPFSMGAHPAGTVGAAVQPSYVFQCELFNGATRLHAWGGPNDLRVKTLPATALTSDQFLNTPGFSADGAPFYLRAAPGGTLPSGITPAQPFFLAYKGDGIDKNRMLRFRSGLYTQHANAVPWVAGANISDTFFGNRVIGADNSIYVNRADNGQWSTGTTSAGGLPIGQTFMDGTITWNRVTIGPVTAPGSGNVELVPLCYTVMGTGMELAHATTLERIHVGHSGNSVLVDPEPWYQFHQALISVPFNTVEVPDARAEVSYWNGSIAVTRMDMNGTGAGVEDERIGEINPLGAIALRRPLDPVARRSAISMAHSWSNYHTHWIDHASGRVPVGNNGPNKAGELYGPGIPNRPTYGVPPVNTSGLHVEASWAFKDITTYTAAYQQWCDGSHLTRPTIAPYLLTGDARFRELQLRQWTANIMGIGNSGGNKQTVGATDYWLVAINTLQPQVRAAGWSNFTIGYMNHLMPSARVESAYVKDVHDDNAAYCAALYPTLGLKRRTLGIWTQPDSPNNNLQPWMEEFNGIARGRLALLGEHPGWRDVFENFHARFSLDRIDSTKGGCGYWTGLRYLTLMATGTAPWTEGVLPNNWGELLPAAYARQGTGQFNFGSSISGQFSPYQCPLTGMLHEADSHFGNSIARHPYVAAIIGTILGVPRADILRQQQKQRWVESVGRDFNEGSAGHRNYPHYFAAYEPFRPAAPAAFASGTASSATTNSVTFELVAGAGFEPSGGMVQHKLATDPDNAYSTLAEFTGLGPTVAGLPSSTTQPPARSFRFFAKNQLGTATEGLVVNGQVTVTPSVPAQPIAPNSVAFLGFSPQMIMQGQDATKWVTVRDSTDTDRLIGYEAGSGRWNAAALAPYLTNGKVRLVRAWAPQGTTHFDAQNAYATGTNALPWLHAANVDAGGVPSIELFDSALLRATADQAFPNTALVVHLVMTSTTEVDRNPISIRHPDSQAEEFNDDRNLFILSQANRTMVTTRQYQNTTSIALPTTGFGCYQVTLPEIGTPGSEVFVNGVAGTGNSAQYSNQVGGRVRFGGGPNEGSGLWTGHMVEGFVVPVALLSRPDLRTRAKSLVTTLA